MRLFRHAIWIARPREAVFDYFADFSRAAEWRQYVRTMEPIEPGPIRAGSTIRVTMDVSGEVYTFDMAVLTCERPGLWRHRTAETDFRGYIEYRFDADNGGTRVTLTCQARAANFFGWIALPVLWLRGGQSYREQLPRLKRAMEAR